MQKLAFLFFMLFFLGLFVMPVYAQDGSTAGGLLDLTSIGMGLAAAGCAIAQSRALTAGCEGVARNPGASDTIRFFIILGLAFIEFLALLTFVYVAFF
jgi:F-type H+-transporting ATPase subunit c